MWARGSMHTSGSPGLKKSRFSTANLRFDVRFPTVSITPFENPVEPEV